MSRSGRAHSVHWAATAIALVLLLAGAGPAQTRTWTGGPFTWPTRWAVAGNVAAAPAEPPAPVTVLAPSGDGVTVMGASFATSIRSGTAVDALGAPIDLVLFSRLQHVTSRLAKAGSPPGGLPLARGHLTSRFGMRQHPLLGGLRMHRGIDLAAPTGTPVMASGGGTVRTADWRGGYGLFVEIDHGGGMRSRYGHMSRLSVQPGQQLLGGEVIGYVGSTGNSTGPHLHYETIQAGLPVDPMHRQHGLHPN